MTDHAKELIRERVDLVAYIEGDLGPHQGTDARPFWCCPFHAEDTASFGVTPDGKMWHCFGCGESGDVFDYVMRRDGCGFVDAKRKLADMVGVGAEGFSRPSPARPSGPPSVARPPAVHVAEATRPNATWRKRAGELVTWAAGNLYDQDRGRAAFELNKWGLYLDTLDTLRLGWVDRPIKDKGASWDVDGDVYLPRGVVFPHIVGGEVWGVKIRRYHGWQPETGDRVVTKSNGDPYTVPKYSQVKGGQCKYFLIDHLQGDRPLLLAEGEKDACLLWQEANDYADVLALGGASMHLTTLTARVLSQYSRIFCAYDVDQAGDKGSETLRQWAGTNGVTLTRVRVPAGTDLVDYYDHGGDVRRWAASIVGADIPPSPFNQGGAV